MRIINLVVRRRERVENVEFHKTIIHCLSPFFFLPYFLFFFGVRVSVSVSVCVSTFCFLN